jgi:hypothetical protein
MAKKKTSQAGAVAHDSALFQDGIQVRDSGNRGVGDVARLRFFFWWD